MMRRLLFICTIILCANPVWGQGYSIRGKVLSATTKKPIDNAVVSIPDYTMWTITGENGDFIINNVPPGTVSIGFSVLGYVRIMQKVTVDRNINGMIFSLKEDNLTLDEVVVTAKRKTDEATTSYEINRTMLDHAQILDIGNITSLLPGESTSGTNNLTSSQQFSLRSGSGEKGNATLGSVVAVDGVQLSSNATMNDIGSSIKGIDTRNISTSNIESVEIITGVPSVEYGDLSNGIIKINTRSGRTPFMFDFVSEPNTKQFALSKGLSLGNNSGVLNVNAEHTKSISDIASPYNSYQRNSLSLTYTNNLNNKKGQPIAIKAGVTGNLGGLNNESDPDFFQNTYTRQRDNVLRGYFNFNWMVNKPWLSNISASASVNYNDKQIKENTYKSSVPVTIAIHGTEEGYYMGTGTYDENPDAAIVLRPGGNWYELKITDSKYLDYTAKLKAGWAHKIGQATNKLMLGADFKRSENLGRGVYYDDMNVAPTWREYRYDELPAMNNLSLYAQEQISIPIQNTLLQLTAGVRSETTMISGSEYGTVNSLSPRFNLKYDIPFNHSFFRKLTIRGGIGEAVKLPTFSVLYPRTTYADRIVFSQTEAQYILPSKPIYNPDLKWQKERLREIGLYLHMKGVNISLSFYNNKTVNPYVAKSIYTPFSFNFTDISQLDLSGIPAANRQYSIDKVTGQVTVSDKTGTLPDEQLAYITRKTFRGNSIRANGSPIIRKGLEWIVDFDKIPALNTSFRIDGKYYYYKGTDETLYQYLNPTRMANGEYYPFIGHYVGATNVTHNGSISKELSTNLTVTTHIPKIRLIVSLRIESTLYTQTRRMSEYNGKPLAFVADPNDLSTDLGGDIYAGDQHVAIFPLYYSTYDDPNTLLNFAEKLAWAKVNDRDLYNELYKLINVTTNDFWFNPNRISAYFNTNLSVTKEIGKYASISFTAKNFLNNMGKVRQSANSTQNTLYRGGLIPDFYYGLSLRLKL